MENINDLKNELSLAIQQLISDRLDPIRTYLDNDGEVLDSDTVCSELERAEEDIDILKEKADELAELWTIQRELEQVENENQ